jgi:hypothetical protein
LLSSWGVEFEAIDTEATPEAMQVLAAFGIPRAPAVIVGDRAVHGWNPQGVAELVGVDYNEAEKLSCVQLAERLDTILVAAQRAMRQIPEAHLGFKWPGRDRTILQLGYHIFRIALTYRDTREQGMLQEYWFGENPSSDMGTGAAVAHFGEQTQAQMAEWLQGEGVFEGMCETYYGPQSAPELFERTVWHTAQHLRQIYVMLETVGVTPKAPLTASDYTGLPLPESIW